LTVSKFFLSVYFDGRLSNAFPFLSWLQLLDVVRGDSYNVVLSLKGSKWVVDTLEKLPEGTEPQISVEELVHAEVVVRKDERVRKYAKDVGEHSSLQ
jgi:hypothetical protein